MRVDACGYLGYAPPPQFDPLLAKVIGSPNSTGSLRRPRSTGRCARSMSSTSTALPTNVDQLRAILAHPAVRAGDARTTLLAEMPTLEPREPRERRRALRVV